MRLTLVLIFAGSFAIAAPVRAQEQSAAILDTQLGADVDEQSGGAVGRLIRAELDGLGVVQTSSGVALDLSEVQLALGCVGETAECLGPVADELSVRFLLIPHLDRAGDELMLTVAVFDRQEGTIRRVVRRAQDRSELLDSVEGLLRELFDLPPAPEEPDGPEGGGGAEEPVTPASSGGELSPFPFVVMGVGAAAVGVGVGFAVAFSDAQSEWENADPQTPDEVDAARDALSRAETHAIVADVMLAVGGAAIAGGLVWMIVELVGGSDGSTDTALAPMVGPHTLGVLAQGRWEAP